MKCIQTSNFQCVRSRKPAREPIEPKIIKTYKDCFQKIRLRGQSGRNFSGIHRKAALGVSACGTLFLKANYWKVYLLYGEVTVMEITQLLTLKIPSL